MKGFIQVFQEGCRTGHDGLGPLSGNWCQRQIINVHENFFLVKDGKLGHMHLVSSLKLGFELSLLHNTLGTTITCA